MATGSVSCSWVGSGSSSYSQFTSTIHLNSNYRACASFSVSGIPAGSTVTGVSVTLTRASNIYKQNQSVSFSAAATSSWNYTSKGSSGATLVYSSSGNRCTGSLSASFGQTLLSMGSGYLHLSAGESDDIIYSGISMTITYTAPETTYTVKCLKGSYGSGTEQTLTKKKGAALTLPGAIFSRSGYTQEGWSTSQYGTSKAYSLNGSYTADADITLYPYWVSSLATYTVTYRPGAKGSGSVRQATKTEGVALALLGAIYTREGYTQTGWSKTDGGAKSYNLGGSYTQNASITLYPYWTANGLPLYRWDGENAILCNLYRWDGEKTMAVYIHSRVKDGEK